ncbi:MAG: GTP 3',8-cyclase MoaA [Lachnospiraceae bacterium]|nr:GTP 3',8-cyclase MoaA [Lachnospiraceae bacterium]
MRDRYGREINYMRISITDRCNLRCVYCMPNGIECVPMSEILTYEEIERVCRQAVTLGITVFKITGGEPLVRLGCPSLVKMIKQIPGVQQVTMTTNGVLFKQYLPELLEAGLDGVNISLDTPDPETYRTITGFNELSSVLDSIEAALTSGIRVKVNAVLLKGINETDWEPLLLLASKRPLDVRFIEQMPIKNGKLFEPVANVDLFADIKNKYPDIVPDKEKHGNGPAVYYRIPGFCGSVGFISPVYSSFCSRCNRIRLSAKGDIKPCLCFEAKENVRAALRDGKDEKVRELLETAIDEKPTMSCFEAEAQTPGLEDMVKIGG